MRKYKCYKCDAMAVWDYVPGGDYPDNYYCNNCVNRGCSCNIIDLCDENATEQYKDDQGKLFPCCEYDYSEVGFDLMCFDEEQDSYDYYYEYFYGET